MTIRRLADDQVIEFSFDKDDIQSIETLMGKYPEDKKQSAVVPCLFYAQKKAGGWLPEKAILAVSELLDMPKIRVLEIATFYSMFNLEPSGEHFIQVCGTTPCWLRGSEKVKKACEDYVGKQREVSKEGLCWIEVECLGACVNAPVIQINDNYYEDLDYESTTKILKALKKGESINKGSQIGRNSSEPNGKD
ncbi:MAG: NADH-quinone oxidoreductase subunit NuoE [Pseudomonadota bacterium]|nr:NADH-quinone oxidoreductase subunit NuoE [Pseudomonadota bacterium]